MPVPTNATGAPLLLKFPVITTASITVLACSGAKVTKTLHPFPGAIEVPLTQVVLAL